jgi:hypothetical protein
MSESVSNRERRRPVLTTTLSRALYDWVRAEVERRGVTTSELVEQLIEAGRVAVETGVGDWAAEAARLRERLAELSCLVEEKAVLEEELARLRAEGRGAVVERLCEVIKIQEQEMRRRGLQPGLSEDGLRLRRLVPLLLDIMPSAPSVQRLVEELARALRDVQYSMSPEVREILDEVETQLLRVLEQRVVIPNNGR